MLSDFVGDSEKVGRSFVMVLYIIYSTEKNHRKSNWTCPNHHLEPVGLPIGSIVFWAGPVGLLMAFFFFGLNITFDYGAPHRTVSSSRVWQNTLAAAVNDSVRAVTMMTHTHTLFFFLFCFSPF